MKKIISFLSALAMICTMGTAFAEINHSEPTLALKLVDVPATLEAGSTFKLQLQATGIELVEESIGLVGMDAKVQIPEYATTLKTTLKAYKDILGKGATKALTTEGKLTYSLGITPAYDLAIYSIPNNVIWEATITLQAVPTTNLEFKLDDLASLNFAEFDYDSGELTSEAKYNNFDADAKGKLKLVPATLEVASTPDPVVTSIEIAGADTVAAEGTATYAATVKDADGAEMADEAVTWSIKEDTTAAAIDAATGVLTAGKPDADTTVTVVATSATKADVSAEKTVTIGKYIAPVVDPTIELTAEAGKDSAVGAYTFFYKAVITAGTEAITAADVTITSGKNSRRAFLSEDMLANIGGGITFYVGNKTADAGRAFSAVGTVNGIATEAVEYTTPAE